MEKVVRLDGAVSLTCPFCGGNALQKEIKSYNKPREYIWCINCQAMMRRHSVKDVIEAWNKRVL